MISISFIDILGYQSIDNVSSIFYKSVELINLKKSSYSY